MVKHFQNGILADLLKDAMHAADESVRGKIVYEVDVIDWEDHIVLMSRD